MPKKTYKRKRSSMSKRSRGMKRYKKTTRSRSRGGDNNNLYNNNNKIYDMDENKPYYNSNYNTIPVKQISNNDKFKGYYKNDDYINNNYINDYKLGKDYIPKNM
jgi:hypothetical protein